MSLLFISGFDLDANRLEPPLLTTSTNFVNEPGRRPESLALAPVDSGTSSASFSYPLQAYNDPANNNLVLTVGGAFKFNGNHDLSPGFIRMITKWGSTGSSESNGHVRVTSDGAITFGSASSAPGLITWGTWNYIEVQWKVTGNNASGSSTLGQQIIRLNGVEVANSSAEGRGKISGLDFGFSRTPNPVRRNFLDDLYIADDDIFRGDVRVDTLVPNANSTPQDWSGSDPLKQNWELINSKDDLTSLTDNIYTFNDGDKSYFDMEDLSLSGYEVLGVQAQYIAQKTDAGLGQIHFAVKDSSGEQVTTDALAMSSNFFNSPVYETDSADDPWNLPKVNDIELGFEADLP